MSSIKYRPEIDGLRALAIVPVVVFHAYNSALPGGYIGVDLFFVISGYLITSIMRKEVAEGRFSFREFWLRRARRILPALTVTVLATLAIGRLVMYPPDLNGLGTHGLATLLSAANFSHWYIAGNYWGDAAENSAFLHAWSLSVEEQFYLLYPPFLVFFLRRSTRHGFVALLVVVIASLALYVVGARTQPAATFYMLPTRGWELGIGGLLALRGRRTEGDDSARPILAFLGMALVVACYVLIRTGGLGMRLVVPVIGVALVIAFAGGPSCPTTRILRTPALVWIGKISYSLYLWHWPALVLGRSWAMKNDAEFRPWLAVLVAVALSVLSYRAVEVPARRSNRSLRYVLPGVAAALVLAGFFRATDFTDGIPIQFAPAEFYGRAYSVAPHRERAEDDGARTKGIRTYLPADADPTAYETGGIQHLYGGPTPEIVVLGDSHALVWGRVLDDAAREQGRSIAFLCADATPVFFPIPPAPERERPVFFTIDEKLAFDRARLRCLEQWRPKVVVIATRWSTVRTSEPAPLLDYIARLGSRVLLVEDPPALEIGDRNAPLFLAYRGVSPSAGVRHTARYLHDSDGLPGHDVMAMTLERFPFCSEVPIADLYLFDGRALAVDSFDVLYLDDDHLSQAGADRARERIATAVDEAFRKQ